MSVTDRTGRRRLLLAVAALILLALGVWASGIGGAASLLNQALLWTTALLAGYSALICSSYVILTAAAFHDLRRQRRKARWANYDEWFRDPNTQGVTVIMPAHNESAGILASIGAMASLHYPDYEIVVVDDGSKDDTADLVIAALDMVEVPLLRTHELPLQGAVLSTWVSRRGAVTVTLVRSSGGGKADALNVGISYARKELVCCVDADSLLESTALLHVARPFAEDPEVVATGGTIRVANGSKIAGGRVLTPQVGSDPLASLQVMEYLRAFFIGRVGWSAFGGLLVISGAFGVFRTSTLVEIGGYLHDCIGEDAELVVRLHRRMYEDGMGGGKVVMVPEPVAWTEAPSSLAVLGRQRRRWHRGLADLFTVHRSMIGRRRFGVIGLVTMPWFFVFELMAPVVELIGWGYLALLGALSIGAGAASGISGSEIGLQAAEVEWAMVGALLGACVLFSAFVTLLALLAEELSYARYRRTGDLARLVAAILGESFGYRQLSLVWRLQGLIDHWRAVPTKWGDMQRQGLGDSPASLAAAIPAVAASPPPPGAPRPGAAAPEEPDPTSPAPGRRAA